MIPGYPNYAINRQGNVYNVNNDRDIATSTGSKHWSGAVKITFEDGHRYNENIASLVGNTFNITSERTLRRNILGTS